MTVTTTSDADQIAPELVRVSVLGAHTQLDVALPVDTPIITLVPDVVALLRIPPPTVDDPDLVADLPRWSLRRIGEPPLPADATLAESGVRDGELLLLTADRPGVPRAMIDDVVDGLAHLTARGAPGWTCDDARRLGRFVCLVTALVAAIAGRVVANSSPLAVAAVSGAAAVTLLAAAAIGHRVDADPPNIATGSACAFIAAMLAGSLVPQPNSLGPALAAAGACGLTTALVAHRAARAAPTLTAFGATLAALVGIGGLAVMGTGEPRAGAAVTATIGVGAVLLAARIAITAGRLPLPPVPSTSPPIPVVDDDRIDGLGATPVGPDRIDAIADLALVDLDDLDRRARRAAGYLTGIVVGASVLIAVATLLTGLGYGDGPGSLLFCAAVAVALIARGRTHADRVQSGALLTAGVCAVAAVLFATGSSTVVFFGAIAVAATAFVVGATAEAHDFSPLQRRALELVEYAVIAAILPLLLWLLDAYRMIREL